jgi:hypothetical protein
MFASENPNIHKENSTSARECNVLVNQVLLQQQTDNLSIIYEKYQTRNNIV